MVRKQDNEVKNGEKSLSCDNNCKKILWNEKKEFILQRERELSRATMCGTVASVG